MIPGPFSFGVLLADQVHAALNTSEYSDWPGYGLTPLRDPNQLTINGQTQCARLFAVGGEVDDPFHPGSNRQKGQQGHA